MDNSYGTKGSGKSVSSNQAKGNGILPCRVEFLHELREVVMDLIEGKEVAFDPRVRSDDLTRTLQDLGLDADSSGESRAGLQTQDAPEDARRGCPLTESLMEGCPELAYTPDVIRVFRHLSSATSLPELNLDDPETAALLDCCSCPLAAAKPATKQGSQPAKRPRRPRTGQPRAPRASGPKKLRDGEKGPSKAATPKKSTKSIKMAPTMDVVLPRLAVSSKESAVTETLPQQESRPRDCLSPSYGHASQNFFTAASAAASFPECESVPGAQPMVLTSSGLIVKLYSFCQVTDGKAE